MIAAFWALFDTPYPIDGRFVRRVVFDMNPMPKPRTAASEEARRARRQANEKKYRAKKAPRARRNAYKRKWYAQRKAAALKVAP